MKALSLRQPWAHFVVHGLSEGLLRESMTLKDIENRWWNTSYRGEVLIHAAKGMTKEEYEDACDFAADALGLGLYARGCVFPQPKALVRGAIIGRTRIVDVIPPCTHCEGLIERAECRHRKWHMPAQFGFVLADTFAFAKPIPWSGALGFFNTPFDRDGRREAGGG